MPLQRVDGCISAWSSVLSQSIRQCFVRLKNEKENGQAEKTITTFSLFYATFTFFLLYLDGGKLGYQRPFHFYQLFQRQTTQR